MNREGIDAIRLAPVSLKAGLLANLRGLSAFKAFTAVAKFLSAFSEESYSLD